MVPRPRAKGPGLWRVTAPNAGLASTKSLEISPELTVPALPPRSRNHAVRVVLPLAPLASVNTPDNDRFIGRPLSIPLRSEDHGPSPPWIEVNPPPSPKLSAPIGNLDRCTK